MSDSHQLSPAVEAFVEFLSLQEAGNADFDAFCAERPALAPKLRRLHARWRELNGALAGMAPVPTVSERLAVRFDADVDPGISLGDAEFDGGTPGTRYLGGEVFARGGMGEVRRVWDRDLRRSLAMKVLLEEAGDGTPGTTPRSDPRALSRFLEEAQITAQLDHPGIVPVHELGLDGDGRVYFTMTLIRGRSFKQILPLVAGGEEDWTRTRALHVLLRVCEAVAYAHDKGVIHRDLKPANIMVGRFGETYVMDWGLARVQGRADRRDLRLRREADAPPSSVRTMRRDAAEDASDSPLVTMDGDVVGTPAYMPPEQARGEVERVGPPADVYAIGAMLYELLAGQMPYVAKGARESQHTVLARVLDGPPQVLEAIAPDVPVELAAICRKAMAREPEQRYPDVVELGHDLRAYLEMRVVGAYETGRWAELRKWVRRNKTVSLAAAVAVLALGVGLVFSLVQKNRADVQAGHAQENSRLAFAAVDRMLSRLGTMRDLPQMDGVRREMLGEALGFLGQLEARGDDPGLRREVAKALTRIGHVQRVLGEYAEAISSFERAAEVLTGYLDLFPGDVEASWDLERARHNLGDVLVHAGRPQEALTASESAVALADELIAAGNAAPDQLASRLTALQTLSVVYQRLGRRDDMVTVARQVLAGRQQIADAQPDDEDAQEALARAHGHLSWSVRRHGDAAEAESESRSAVTIYAELCRRQPTNRVYRHAHLFQINSLSTLMGGDRLAEAVALLRDNLDGVRALVADYPEAAADSILLSMMLSNLGGSLHQLGQTAAGVQFVEEALEVASRARQVAPDDATLQKVWIDGHHMIVVMRNALGEYQTAAAGAEALASATFGGARPRELAAWFFAACAGRARDDRRTDLAEVYAQRSLVLLAAAVEQGLSDVTLFDEPEFEPVRQSAEFERLRAIVAERGK